MYYLIDSTESNREVVASYVQKADTDKEIKKFFEKIAGDRVTEAKDWLAVGDICGFFYVKEDDNKYTLKKYVLDKGYIYNGMKFENLATVYVSYFEPEKKTLSDIVQGKK